MLNDVRLNSHAEVIRLARQISCCVHVTVGSLEFRITQIAPKYRRHSEFVCVCKGLSHLGDLPRRIVAAKIYRSTDRDRTHISCLLDRAKHHLIELIRIRQKLVMIDLYDERNLMRVFTRDHSEHAIGRGNSVTTALDGELDDVLRIEIHGVRRERCSGRVLDALIDRQD